MKVCIFPNDPIISYYNKGEIKERYYNPNNFFQEIHIISFIEKDVEESKVQILAGNAKLKIHSVEKISLKNRSKHLEDIISLIKTINPDVIRAYNPFLEGWFAAKCSNKLKIPFFLSLHTQYDYNRKLVKRSNLKKYLALKYTEKFIEPFVIQKADKITIVFKIIEPYVIKHGGKKPELLYNKINFKQFSNAEPTESFPKPLIISVGRLIKEKNHKCIIDAMKNIDAHYLIIGDGPLNDELTNKIKKEKLEAKVSIVKSVPNNKIQNFYKSAKVFALAYDPEQEGLPIPVIEAMASGMPIVIPYPKEGFSDGLEKVAIFSERTSDSFSKNIHMLLENPDLHKEFSVKSQKKAMDFDMNVIDTREAKIYGELVK